MAQRRTAPMGARSNDQLRRPVSSSQDTSEEMQSFYEDMQRTDQLERKLSARKSVATSVWSPTPPKPATPPAHASSSSVTRAQSSRSDVNGADSGNEGKSERDRPNGYQLNPSRSIITETKESATWAEKGKWTDVPAHSFRVKYPLHNPMGPRWYRNHHLIPPSEKKPSMRPPTFFSPSFPPIHTSSSPINILGSSEGLDATPSESPLPTPTSSQTRVAEGGKRSRKTSQTTPDNVDLLDVTDPWGQSWHHRSPYDFDFGSSATATSPDGHQPPVRPRRASTTAVPNKFQSVTPSPLSQSTSAVHLPGSMPQIHVPRKLSKRRTPTAEAVFNPQPHPQGEHRKAASVPHTPIETAHIMSSRDHIPLDSAVLPIRMTVAPPPAQSSMFQTPKKEKRGSMLNRLARKFSLLRKSSDEPPTIAGSEYWHRVESNEIQGYINGHGNAANRRSVSPNKSTRESVKRVPPPSADPPEPPAPPPPAPSGEKPDADRASLTSLETPFSMGRLTIANPDTPELEKEAVVFDDPPMSPVQTPEEPVEEVEALETVSSPLSASFHLSPNDAWSRFEKPLPLPQLATPKFSELGISVPEQSTPEAVEEPLPPPPPEKPPLTRTASSHPSSSAHPEGTKQADPLVEAPPQSPVQETAPELETPDDQSVLVAPPELSPSPAPETPKRSATIVSKQLPASPETTPDRSQSQSPPMPQSWAQYETPERTAQVLPSPSVLRKKTVSPAPPVVSATVPEPAASVQVAPSAPPEPVPEPPSAIRRASAKATRTLSRTKQAVKAAPAPVSVPAPDPSAQELPVPAVNGSTYTQHVYEVSPMSTSSILVNPPTPYDFRQSITLTPDQSAPPSLPPKSIYEGKTSHNPSPLRTSALNPSQSNPSPSRQTETFRLVRSSSGNVYASGQTIHAQGEQWEVVESTDTPKGRKEKASSSKNKESEHRHREHDRKSARYSPKEPEYKSRDRDQEYRSRDHDYRPRDSERRSKDYEYRSREVDYKEHDRKSREPEYRPRDYDRSSKDFERKSEYYRSKDYERSKDRDRPRDHDKSREYDRSRDYDAPRTRESRAKDYDVVRESERARDREHERARESERAREHERRREAERQKEAERQREAERQKEAERREREAERLREVERQREIERQREAEMLREAERQREVERQREIERQREREAERQREREAERQREREAERQREREAERQRAREAERQREREAERQREREAERQRERAEREAERQREKEAERQRERELERQREAERKAKEAERRHAEREQRRREKESKRTTQTVIEVVPSTDYYISSAYRLAKPAAPDPYMEEAVKLKSSSKTKSRRADGRSRDEHRLRKSEQKPVEAIPFPTSTQSSRPHVAPAHPPKEPTPSLRLERIPSLSARPTSELPSAAEMNAIRAKESWEMERLWKARSMYGLEPNAPTSNFIHDAGSSSSKSDEAHTQSAVYGSSHTAYVVSSPFSSSGRGSQIYHSMPTAPPPIIYSSPASIPSIPDLTSNYDPHEHPPYRSYNTTQGNYRASGDDFKASTSLPRPPLSNPLPEPPREFPLDLKSGAKSNNRQSNDYWTKYNGITATH